MTAADDGLQKHIRDLPFRVRRELVKAIKGEADRLASAIKAKAPVRTGKLRDSVKVRRRRNELEFEVVAGGDATVNGTAGPGGEADYALFVEYGTVNKPAQPFFYSTARAMQPKIRENIERAIEEALK